MPLKIVGVSVTYSCNGTRSASFDLSCKFSEREEIGYAFPSLDCVIRIRSSRVGKGARGKSQKS